MYGSRVLSEESAEEERAEEEREEEIVVSEPYDDAVDCIVGNQVVGEMEMEAYTSSEASTIASNCKYISDLQSTSKLHVLRPQLVRSAYERAGETGLFFLFLKKQFIVTTLRKWTNNNLVTKGIKPMPQKEMLALLGLELADGILGYNTIKQLWTPRIFGGHPDFPRVMARYRFEELRGSLRVVPTEVIEEHNGSLDKRERQGPPVGYSFTTFAFLRNRAETAVPTGASALDENSMPSKGRSPSISYIPSKTDKYAVRFYAVVGKQYNYLHTMFDNGSGNLTGICPIHRYCDIIPQLRRPITKSCEKENSVPLTPASALWVGMVGTQVQKISVKTIDGDGTKRILFVDNYYTRHSFANSLSDFTDSEFQMIGTVRMNFIDKHNKKNVINGIISLSEKERVTWSLVPASSMFRSHPSPISSTPSSSPSTSSVSPSSPSPSSVSSLSPSPSS